MKRLTLTLGLLLIMITVGCGTSNPGPEAKPSVPPQVLEADYNKLYADYVEIQMKYGLLEAQYNNLKYNHEVMLEYLVTDSTFKEQFETIAEQYEMLSSQHSKIEDDLLLVNARKDPIINELYPSDNETEKARWETFYEFWDSWWAEFEDNL